MATGLRKSRGERYGSMGAVSNEAACPALARVDHDGLGDGHKALEMAVDRTHARDRRRRPDLPPRTRNADRTDRDRREKTERVSKMPSDLLGAMDHNNGLRQTLWRQLPREDFSRKKESGRDGRQDAKMTPILQKVLRF